MQPLHSVLPVTETGTILTTKLRGWWINMMIIWQFRLPNIATRSLQVIARPHPQDQSPLGILFAFLDLFMRRRTKKMICSTDKVVSVTVCHTTLTRCRSHSYSPLQCTNPLPPLHPLLLPQTHPFKALPPTIIEEQSAWKTEKKIDHGNLLSQKTQKRGSVAVFPRSLRA